MRIDQLDREELTAGVWDEVASGRWLEIPRLFAWL